MSYSNPDFTFKDVQKFLKDDNEELVKDIDAIASILILFSPLVFTIPQATVLTACGVIADLFGIKDGLKKLSRRISSKITSKSNDDEVMHFLRIKTAFVLICYTSFFDALNDSLPIIMKTLNLTSEEKFSISKSAIKQISRNRSDNNVAQEPEILHVSLKLPHPACPFTDQKTQLIPLYNELSKGFLHFLKSFRFIEEMDDNQLQLIDKEIKKLPEKAYSRFEAQYLSLASSYKEFFVWANLQEFIGTQKKISRLSKKISNYILSAEEANNTIDVGMKNLQKSLEELPQDIASFQANKALNELSEKYAAQIESTIVEDSGHTNSDKPELKYPKKSEIFIPQSFQVVNYSGDSLENEETWKNAHVRDDLGQFLLSFLSSPYSVHSPLIILGLPGSGKSLLTNMLASRFMKSPFLPIRVILRDIKANNEIPVQIEEQIKLDTNRDVKWADLSDSIENKQALIMLDGYDELLQASGRVFSGYLRSVQKFQENEISIGREPIRSIVTSRITLIDKADIPIGTTIIKLLPFTEKQQEKWVSIWNKTNKDFFKKTQNEPFNIPRKEKLLSLAEQPLLLLMLALYDSEGNMLRQEEYIDQTALYDSLLRRFIVREREKPFGYTKSIPEEEIDKDIERLAAAAMGMFNRRTLSIKVSELNRDLKYCKLEREIDGTSGEILSQAELLLGSFFFVHESSSTHVSNTTQKYQDTAFEFLHNTFGEFLTAEYILQKVIKVCKDLNRFQDDDSEEYRRIALCEKFPAECLSYAPLHSRPVILDMMREWLPHKLKKNGIKSSDFLPPLHEILTYQINLLITSHKLPPVITGDIDNNPYSKLPILGHIAIYSLNLILLGVFLDKDGFKFYEEEVILYEDGQRAWDRLTYLWRSWFSLDNLYGLSAVVKANRDHNVINLHASQIIGSPISTNNRLDMVSNVAQSLADNILIGITGYFEHGRKENGLHRLKESSHLLLSEGVDLQTEILLKQITYGENIQLLWDYFNSKETIDLSTGNLISIINLSLEHGSIYNKLIILYDIFRHRDISNYPIPFQIKAIKIAKIFNDKDFSQETYSNMKSTLDIVLLASNDLLDIINLAYDFKDIELLNNLLQSNKTLSSLRNISSQLNFLKDQYPSIQFDQKIIDFADNIKISRHSDNIQIEISELLQWNLNINTHFDASDFLQFRDRGQQIRISNFRILIEFINLSWDFGDRENARNLYKIIVRSLEPHRIPNSLFPKIISIAKKLNDNAYITKIIDSIN